MKIHAFDCGYDPQRSIIRSQLLDVDKNVRRLLHLGGDTFSLIQDFVTRHRVLT